jgi:hypothetical protein
LLAVLVVTTGRCSHWTRILKLGVMLVEQLKWVATEEQMDKEMIDFSLFIASMRRLLGKCPLDTLLRVGQGDFLGFCMPRRRG